MNVDVLLNKKKCRTINRQGIVSCQGLLHLFSNGKTCHRILLYRSTRYKPLTNWLFDLENWNGKLMCTDWKPFKCQVLTFRIFLLGNAWWHKKSCVSCGRTCEIEGAPVWEPCQSRPEWVPCIDACRDCSIFGTLQAFPLTIVYDGDIQRKPVWKRDNISKTVKVLKLFAERGTGFIIFESSSTVANKLKLRFNRRGDLQYVQSS